MQINSQKMRINIKIVQVLLILLIEALPLGSSKFRLSRDLSLIINEVNEIDLENFDFDNPFLEGKCLNHLQAILRGLTTAEEFALKFFDSWGRPPFGVLWYNTVSLGNFDECLSIDQHLKADDSIKGQYCLAELPTGSFLSNASMEWMTIGICIPASCPFEIVINSMLELMVNGNNTSGSYNNELCSKKEELILSSFDILAIIIFSSFGLLVFLSTGYECFAGEIIGSNNILNSFSLRSNGIRLLSPCKENLQNILPCLYGIRALSAIWIIFSMAYYAKAVQPLLDQNSVSKWTKRYYPLILINSTLSIDTFLLLSGFLVTWCTFKKLNQKKSINIPMFYLHRYLRLFPALAMIILLSSTLLRFMGSGPFWNVQMTNFESCRNYWWSALLHVQNFVNPHQICIESSWYISIDFQLYLLSPIILLALWRWRFTVVWIVPCLVIGSAVSVYLAFTAIDENLDKTGSRYMKLKEQTYHGPHLSAGPWLTGVLLAYLMFSIKSRRIPKFILCFGWCICITTIVTLLFGVVGFEQQNIKFSTLHNGIFEACSRILWSLAISWLIFVCSQRKGGVIAKFLMLQIWRPISRLSYTMLIIHSVIYDYANGVIRTRSNFSYYENIIFFWGNFAVIFIVSILIVLIFECPIQNLEALFVDRKRTERNSNSKLKTQHRADVITNNNSTNV